MILSSDLVMYHPLWEQADDEFCSNGGLGIFVRLIDLYVIACAIGIKEDKVVLDSDIANPLSSPKTIGRNTHRENLDIRDMMDFMLQNALLNSKTIDFGDDERLKLAFNPDYSNKKINAASFLTGFATYGLTQIYKQVKSRSSLVAINELYTYLESLANEKYDDLLKTLTLEPLSD